MNRGSIGTKTSTSARRLRRLADPWNGQHRKLLSTGQRCNVRDRKIIPSACHAGLEAAPTSRPGLRPARGKLVTQRCRVAPCPAALLRRARVVTGADARTLSLASLSVIKDIATAGRGWQRRAHAAIPLLIPRCRHEVGVRLAVILHMLKRMLP